jgi:hypothetical protein
MRNLTFRAWSTSILAGVSLLSLALGLFACQASPAPTQPTSSTPDRIAPVLASPTQTTAPMLTPSPVPSLTATLHPSPTPFPTSALNPLPSPTFDRLAEPPLPPNPTQLEKGAHLFWLNCAACHGDLGQGLTDEWRSVYVEDANCWARGCHAGHNGDQGFPIPRDVPAIISTTKNVLHFSTPQSLFNFLRTTHPPQNPGFMPDSDYWALTAYLWEQNGRLAEGEVLGP